MKKFAVVVHYEGAMNYEVEAETEEEARDIADQMFNEEDDREISAQIASSVSIVILEVSICPRS